MILWMWWIPFGSLVEGVDASHLVLLSCGLIYPKKMSAFCSFVQVAELAYLVYIVAREWSVRGHEEMAAWSRYKTGNDTNQIIVHVTWVTQCRRRCSHHSRNLSQDQH